MKPHCIPTGPNGLTAGRWYDTVPPAPRSYRPTSTLQVDRFQSFSLVIRHVISAQLSARLGSVTLGRRRRSLDSDLDISTHRSEISGKVARPLFFLKKVARRQERRQRSLDSDLNISAHRSEISGKVARPFFFGGP